MACRLFPCRHGHIFYRFYREKIVLIYVFRITESATLWHHLITLVEMVEKNKLWTDKLPCLHETVFSLSFSYILFSCRRTASVQVLSGFEVNRVVFMCVCVFVYMWTCKAVEIQCVFVCLSVCLIKIYKYIGAELLFCSTSSFYLLIQYFRMVWN